MGPRSSSGVQNLELVSLGPRDSLSRERRRELFTRIRAEPKARCHGDGDGRLACSLSCPNGLKYCSVEKVEGQPRCGGPRPGLVFRLCSVLELQLMSLHHVTRTVRIVASAMKRQIKSCAHSPVSCQGVHQINLHKVIVVIFYRPIIKIRLSPENRRQGSLNKCHD